MPEKSVLFNIQVMKDGGFVLSDAKGQPLKELNSANLGESLYGREIKETTILPTMTILKSNPTWLNLGGRWYYIP